MTSNAARWLLLILFAAMLSLRLLANWPASAGLRLFDEAAYLYSAINGPVHFYSPDRPATSYLDNYGDCGLYSLWLRSIYQVVSDPAWTMRISDALLLSTLILFATLTIYQISRSIVIAACCIAAYILLGYATTDHTSSLLAIVLILIGIFACGILRWQRTASVAICIIVSWALTYVRPEYIAALYLFLAWGALDLTSNIWLTRAASAPPNGNRLQRILVGSTALLLVSLAFLHWGVPRFDNARGFLAFTQHYNLQASFRGQGGADAWGPRAADLVNATFLGANSVAQAASRNPHAFVMFLLWNIFLAAKFTLVRFARGVSSNCALAAFIFGIAAFSAARTRWASFQWIHCLAATSSEMGSSAGDRRADLAPSGEATRLAATLIFLASTSLAVVSVFPRGHYVNQFVAVAGLCTLACLGARANPGASTQVRRNGAPLLATGAVLAFVVALTHPFPVASGNIDQRIAKMASMLSAKSVIELDEGFSAYCQPKCAQWAAVTGSGKDIPNADVIVLSARMDEFLSARPDEFARLSSEVNDRANWSEQKVDADFSILVRVPTRAEAHPAAGPGAS